MLFTWSVVHLIEQAFAECQWGSADYAVGPALTDRLEQKRLSPCGLYSEVRKLKNTLCGGDRGPFAPARLGHETKRDKDWIKDSTLGENETERESGYGDNNK